MTIDDNNYYAQDNSQLEQTFGALRSHSPLLKNAGLKQVSRNNKDLYSSHTFDRLNTDLDRSLPELPLK